MRKHTRAPDLVCCSSAPMPRAVEAECNNLNARWLGMATTAATTATRSAQFEPSEPLVHPVRHAGRNDGVRVCAASATVAAEAQEPSPARTPSQRSWQPTAAARPRTAPACPRMRLRRAALRTFPTCWTGATPRRWADWKEARRPHRRMAPAELHPGKLLRTVPPLLLLLLLRREDRVAVVQFGAGFFVPLAPGGQLLRRRRRRRRGLARRMAPRGIRRQMYPAG